MVQTMILLDGDPVYASGMLEEAIDTLTIEIRKLRQAVQRQNEIVALRREARAAADKAQVAVLPELVDERTAAGMLAVSVAALRRWRLLSQGPPFRKVGSLVRYPCEELRDWLRHLPMGGSA